METKYCAKESCIAIFYNRKKKSPLLQTLFLYKKKTDVIFNIYFSNLNFSTNPFMDSASADNSSLVADDSSAVAEFD